MEEIYSEKLKNLNKEFKREKARTLVRKYLIRLLIIFLLLLFILTSYAAYLGYSVQKKLSSHSGIEKAKKVLAETPSGNKPFNVLLIGSDSRGKERGRSDTLIVLRVVPKEKKAFLVSIPRDYRVKIPGYGLRKVNAAYALGGSELAIRTISEFIGIEIHHYAIIDFKGFVKVVDALGGITVNVEKRLYEPNNSRANLYPGVQRLNGSQALAYVRFRHDEEGDFGRIRRQQEFLKALANELLKPQSVPKYPRIANIVVEYVETDLSVPKIISLARYFAMMGGINISSIMLPGKPQTIAGASYVIPDEAKLKIIVDKVFKENRLPSSKELIDPATIKVKVFNGAGKPGLARAVSSYLKDYGFRITGSKNADRFDYQVTVIIYKSGHRDEAELVEEFLHFGEIIEADSKYEKMLGTAIVGVIAGLDSLSYSEISERMRQ